MPEIKLKSVMAVNAKVEEILSKTTKEKADLEKRLEAAEAAEKAAAGKMDAALIAGDIDAYKAATAAQNDAKFEIKACKVRLEYIENRALIQPAEYAELFEAVHAEADGRAAEIRRKVLDMTKKMSAWAAELSAVQDEANTALSRLQYDVKHDFHRDLFGPCQNAVDHKSLIRFLEGVTTGGWYEDVVKQEEAAHAE